MRNEALYRLLARGMLGIALLACSDPPTAPEDLDHFAAAPGGPSSSTCDLVKDITSDTRTFFPVSDRKPALDAVSVMGTECKNGNTSATNTAAWTVLGLVDALVNAGKGGDPVVGSRLLNGLIACTKGLCVSADLESPLIDFQPALGPLGLFGVRTEGLLPIVARNPMPFGAGIANTARWGVESPNWQTVIAGESNAKLIIFGAPAPTLMQLQDAGIGNLQFNLDRFPNSGQFADGQMRVGACFANDYVLPHIDGDENKPHMPERVQRNAVLLETLPAAPTFCGQNNLQTASLLGGAASFLRELVPESWRLVFFGDRSVTVVGGTPLDFSTFSAVTAHADGFLEMLQGPESVVVQGEPIGNIRIGAKSGAGTPMEKVKITLSVYNNQGVPAGAVLSGTTEGYTSEDDGTVTLSEAVLGKAGGYIICADGQLNGFTFAQVCSSLFTARNQ
jgi:hypothetical protein